MQLQESGEMYLETIHILSQRGKGVRAVDVAVRRLREKVEDDPANPDYVLTKRGVGYYLAE